MNLPNMIRLLLLRHAKAVMASRPPDMIVGHTDNPYMHRWRLFARNNWFNLYIHKFFRDDDDRALHDHPWNNCSLVLENGYYEQLSHKWEDEAGYSIRYFRAEGYIGFRRAEMPHRVLVRPGALPITMFFHTMRYREWGFHCLKGWVPWQRFHGMNNPADPNDSSGPITGTGCGE